MEQLDVIIPTRNRIESLRLCLDSIDKQTLDKSKYRVIIVDDGSSPGNLNRLNSLIGKYTFAIKLLQNNGKGPARARNLGIDNSSAGVILFLNDDVILVSEHFEVHLAYHRKNPGKFVCVRGKSIWHPDLPDTSIMRYMRKIHLRYDLKIDESIRELAYFHTMDLSFKGDLLREIHFDEDFPVACFEDTELGWRLKKSHKLSLLIAPEAKSFHYHFVTLRELINRAKTKGYGASLVLNKHPELYDLLLGRFLRTSNKQRIYNIIKNIIAFKFDDIWEDVESFYYLRGFGKTIKNSDNTKRLNGESIKNQIPPKSRR